MNILRESCHGHLGGTSTGKRVGYFKPGYKYTVVICDSPKEKFFRLKPNSLSQAKQNHIQCFKRFLTSTEVKHSYEKLTSDGSDELHNDVYLDYEMCIRDRSECSYVIVNNLGGKVSKKILFRPF